MNETTATTNKKGNFAVLPDGEYYAKPHWFKVKVKDSKMRLEVVWAVCDKDGNLGRYDVATGNIVAVPEGYDGWERAVGYYPFGYAEEVDNGKKCLGKPFEFLKDVCPQTYKGVKRIQSWCPEWSDFTKWDWFYTHKEEFCSIVVRITIVHEQWSDGSIRASVKWTNPKERPEAADMDKLREDVTSLFGGFFDVSESAPAPKAKNTPSGAPSASNAMPPPDSAKVTKADAWAEYCKHYNARDTAPWFETIKEIGGGKRESEFLSADWASVIETLIKNMPF